MTAPVGRPDHHPRRTHRHRLGQRRHQRHHPPPASMQLHSPTVRTHSHPIREPHPTTPSTPLTPAPTHRLDRKGHGWCAWCRDTFPASDVDVDHVRPLASGGTDTDGNVQVLCRGCRRLKTEAEFGATA
ncbi:HNH endonuclease [Streptomyces sp. 769]|uniref:HNH endonuclease n=1 Tax=Streptomyces sp. 769 TaxID=1262452 RepID=UPI0031B590C2